MERPASEYQEYRPAPGLEPYVACTWSQVIGDGDAAFLQRILPDGCADLVWVGDSMARVIGPATRTVVEALPPGTCIVGLRFRPGTASAALGVPAAELRNLELTLDTLWGQTAGLLSERVAESDTIRQKLGIIEAVIGYRLARIRDPDAVVLGVVAALQRRLHLPVEATLAEAGVSERQLRRRFYAAVGYGPKVFQRIARLVRLRELAVSRGPRPIQLARVAAELGYADQAHMTRDVRALSGLSPRQLVGRAAALQRVSDRPVTELSTV